jgi:hypothetical protein
MGFFKGEKLKCQPSHGRIFVAVAAAKLNSYCIQENEPAT